MAKKFCTSCGAPLTEATRVCPQCGAEGNLPPAAVSTEPPAAAPPAGSPQDVYSPAPAPAPQAAPPRPQKAVRPPVQQQPVQQPVYAAEPVQQPVYAAPPAYAPQPKAAPQARTDADGRYDLISTGGFVGILLLLMIPIVGLILMIVWACGGCKKQVKRNFARAMLILTAIMLVLGLVFTLAFRSYTMDLLSSFGLDGMSGSGSLATSDLLGMAQESPASGMDMPEALTGSDSGSTDAGSLDELESLAGLAGLLQGGDLSALAGLEGLVGTEGYEDLLQSQGAPSAKGGSWPAGLLPYDGGTITGSEQNKLFVSGATQDGFQIYVEQLKSSGYYFRDFYNMDFDETEMLEYMNAWWGTNDSLWLSMAYYDESTKEIMEVDYDLMIEYYDYDPTA